MHVNGMGSWVLQMDVVWQPSLASSATASACCNARPGPHTRMNGVRRASCQWRQAPDIFRAAAIVANMNGIAILPARSLLEVDMLQEKRQGKASPAAAAIGCRAWRVSCEVTSSDPRRADFPISQEWCSSGPQRNRSFKPLL